MARLTSCKTLDFHLFTVRYKDPQELSGLSRKMMFDSVFSTALIIKDTDRSVIEEPLVRFTHF